jgi:hypothetical protein
VRRGADCVCYAKNPLKQSKECKMCHAKVALRNERDWLCKDRLLEGYIKMGIVSQTLALVNSTKTCILFADCQ